MRIYLVRYSLWRREDTVLFSRLASEQNESAVKSAVESMGDAEDVRFGLE